MSQTEEERRSRDFRVEPETAVAKHRQQVRVCRQPVLVLQLQLLTPAPILALPASPRNRHKKTRPTYRIPSIAKLLIINQQLHNLSLLQTQLVRTPRLKVVHDVQERLARRLDGRPERFIVPSSYSARGGAARTSARRYSDVRRRLHWRLSLAGDRGRGMCPAEAVGLVAPRVMAPADGDEGMGGAGGDGVGVVFRRRVCQCLALSPLDLQAV